MGYGGVPQASTAGVAFAVDRPGWSRGAATVELALSTLGAYRERYRPVAARAGMRVCDAGEVDVIEDRVGTGSTDFWGISFAPCGSEQGVMPDAELERKLTLLPACRAYFDDVASRVSAEMRKSPRGGGRHSAYHVMDHAWDMEDEDLSSQAAPAR